MSAQAYPLAWPIGRPRWSGSRQPSKFRIDERAMVDQLHRELELMKATDIVISTNQQRYSKANYIDDPGVAVYFKRKGQELCIACDKYLKVSDNLQAVGIAIEAFRTIERHGTGEMVDAAFTGFKALPEAIIMGEHTARAWWEVLQVSPNADMDVIEAAYKRLLHKAHPDKSGSDFAFQELQNAYKQAKEEKR